MDKRMKLVSNIGTTLVERKGKTELIANSFGIEYKNTSNLDCEFHRSCVSLYTNLSSMTGDEPVIVADIHGDIFEAQKDQNVIKVLANSTLIILHVHSK